MMPPERKDVALRGGARRRRRSHAKSPALLSRVSTRKHPSISIVSVSMNQRGCGLPARREHLANCR